MKKLTRLAVIPIIVGFGLIMTSGANANSLSSSNNPANAFQSQVSTQLKQHAISKQKLAVRCYRRYYCRKFCKPSVYYRAHYRCYRHGRVIYTRSNRAAHRLHNYRGYRCVKVKRYYRGYRYGCRNVCRFYRICN